MARADLGADVAAYALRIIGKHYLTCRSFSIPAYSLFRTINTAAVAGKAQAAVHTPVRLCNSFLHDKWQIHFIEAVQSPLHFQLSPFVTTISEGDDIFDFITGSPAGIHGGKDAIGIENAEALAGQPGIIRLLADMAKNNGALYGIISIMVALSAGFGVGIIFKRGRSGH